MYILHKAVLFCSKKRKISTVLHFKSPIYNISSDFSKSENEKQRRSKITCVVFTIGSFRFISKSEVGPTTEFEDKIPFLQGAGVQWYVVP